MFILSLFNEIKLLLIAYKELMTAVSRLDSRGVHLVTIPQHDAMEASANHARYRNGGRIANSSVQQALFVGVFHACGDVGTIARAVCSHQSRRLYLNKRISQRNIASAS